MLRQHDCYWISISAKDQVHVVMGTLFIGTVGYLDIIDRFHTGEYEP